MTIKKSAIRVAIPSTMMLVAIGPAAFADGISGLYVGGSAGSAKIGADYGQLQSQLEGEAEGFGTLQFTTASLHNRNTAWWFNTGYMAWPIVGIDASYLHLGEIHNQVDGTYTPDGGTSIPISATTRLKSEGPALGLLFRLPLAEDFALNIRVADYYAKTTLSTIIDLNGTTATEQTAKRSSLLLGLGASYSFLGHWSARFDYLRVQHAGDSATVGTYNVDMFAAGVSYTF
ncbi:MAG TPA: outer membrane beta-barrel protein [Steroidobacteraceae bacterium]